MFLKHYLSIVVTLSIFAPINTYAWPWSDSSKYRNECRQACIEDSFGKAKALEISQRCSNKCDGLPLSPRDQWYWYEKCLSDKEEYEAYERIRPRCEKERNDLRDSRYSSCMKKKYSTEYSCKLEASPTYDDNEISKECLLINTPYVVLMNKKPDCIKPALPKPK